MGRQMSQTIYIVEYQTDMNGPTVTSRQVVNSTLAGAEAKARKWMEHPSEQGKTWEKAPHPPRWGSNAIAVYQETDRYDHIQILELELGQ